MNEGLLQDRIRLALGSDPSLVLWRNNIGQAVMHGGARVTFGVGGKGGADLLGIFRGRFVAVEIKTPVGRQTSDQRLFQQLVERKGGIYVILRSVDDATAWLRHMHEIHGSAVTP